MRASGSHTFRLVDHVEQEALDALPPNLRALADEAMMIVEWSMSAVVRSDDGEMRAPLALTPRPNAAWNQLATTLGIDSSVTIPAG